MLATDPPGIVHDHVDLDALADEIKALHVEAEEHSRKGVQFYVLIGERLLKAKKAVGDGGWLRWLAKHQPCSVRQAQRYMKVASIAEHELTAEALEGELSKLDVQWQIISGNTAEDDATLTSHKPDAPSGNGLFGPTEPWPKGYKPCRHHRINPKKWSPKCKKCIENNKSSDAPSDNGATSAAGTKPADSGATAEGHGGPSAGPDPTDYLAYWNRTEKTLKKRLHQMRVALVIPPQAVKAAREAFRVLQEFVVAHADAPIRQPEEAVCKRCGDKILFVTTAAHKRAALDDKAKGPVHIMPDGIAVQVTEEGTGAKSKDGRQWHFLCCTSKEPVE